MVARRLADSSVRPSRCSHPRPDYAYRAGTQRTVNPDFADFLAALIAANARFIVVGAHALAAHGLPRATGDMDIWIDRALDNPARVWTALTDFGAPTIALGLKQADLEAPDTVIQIGLEPRRIDILTDVTGLHFDQAWDERVIHQVGLLSIPFLGRNDLVRNKRATGRYKDLGDLEALGEDPQVS